MWNHWFDLDRIGSSRRRRLRGPDLDRLLAVGLAAAAVVFMASFLPGPLAAAVIAEACYMGALLASVLAMLRGERPMDKRITGWDQAALFLLFALAAGFFVDPAAVSELMPAPQAGRLGVDTGAPPRATID